MPSVTCPSCGEKGRVPSQFIGARIKCKACGNSFLVGPAAKADAGANAPAPAVAASARGGQPAGPRYEGIEVEGLDETSWSADPVAAVRHEADHSQAPEESAGAFVPHEGGTKEYMILSPRDKFFAGKFDLDLLEKALNHYAGQGWVVKSMATPHVAVFGAEREQIVILMER